MLLFIAVLTVAGAVAVAAWLSNPKRELERSKRALLQAASWHHHRVVISGTQAPATFDTDIVCPNSSYFVSEGTRSDGTVVKGESVRYRGQNYHRVDGQWTASQKTEVDGRFQDCNQYASLLYGDDSAAAYDEILKEGTIRSGELKQVDDGETCRIFDITIPTPRNEGNILHHEYTFSICINESDHLPRETRDPSHPDIVNTYSQWNRISEPVLPGEFPRQ